MKLKTIIKKNFVKMFSNCHSNKLKPLILIIFVIIFVFYLLNIFNKSTCQNCIFSKNIDEEINNYVYGIMFDAGSTGSRMHIFRFENNSDGSFILKDDLFRSIKPGLSHYKEDPIKAAYSLKNMLDEALVYIPKNYWSETILALRATAGLRLLPSTISDNILSEVLKLFKNFPFKTGKKFVKIMDGFDEGLFSWFTVNYLHKYLNNENNSVGILELGGGSTQITYLSHKKNSMSKDIYPVILNNMKQTIYTHSYLGLGIMEVRFFLLGGNKKASDDYVTNLTSICLPSKYSGKWEYGGEIHFINAMHNYSKSRYNKCFSKIENMLKNFSIEKPVEMNFHAISFFYDRAVDAKLINKTVPSALIKVGNYNDAAKIACKSNELTQPFLCLDLCYISSLLQIGYGFLADKEIMVENKVMNFEIAWPLGAILENFGKFYRIPN